MRDLEPESAYPLSPMQQGMLFHSFLAPHSGGNIQQIIGTLYHELDYAVFKRAWQCVVQPQYDQRRFDASAIVVLEAMPLTPNGKVDRRKLPAPEVIRAELEGAFVAPKNPVEEALATIWREILGVEKIGRRTIFLS
jgi:hypothetical protein